MVYRLKLDAEFNCLSTAEKNGGSGKGGDDSGMPILTHTQFQDVDFHEFPLAFLGSGPAFITESPFQSNNT